MGIRKNVLGKKLAPYMMGVVLAVGLIPLPAFAAENGSGSSAQLTVGLTADGSLANGSQGGEPRALGTTALGLETEDADHVISSKPIVITSSNSSQYNGKTITGTLEAQCTSDAFSAAYLDNSGQRGAIIIDGVEVSLTISDLSVKATTLGGENTTVSPIMLVNGATLNLNLEGTNALTASYGGAGIYVPQGCTLIVNSTDNGSLTATGGDFGPYAQNGYAGGAGIGGAAKTKKDMEPSVGSITIASGNVIAKGGGTTNYGAAGIGGSSTCSAGNISITGGTVTATGGIFAAGIGNGINGMDTLHNGSISIIGGTVTATGDESAAGIGGGAYDSVSTISITGGTVSATSRRMGCAIGSGYGREYMGTVTSVPSVSITGGNVTAAGNIGHPTTGDYAAGGSFTLGDSADVSCTGEVTYDSATKHTINVMVYDPTITTALNDQPATLTLGNSVPVSGMANVTTAGVATFTVQKIVDYGSADSKTVSATAKIGNTTVPAASNVLTKSSKTCNVYVGYRLHLTGTIFDDDIQVNQTGTATINGADAGATITCTQRKAVISGWQSMNENGGVADDRDFSATVTVTIGDKEYNIDSVAFKKTSAHQKTGAFQQGQDSIDYVDENGATQTSEGFTRLENNTTALDAGKWYTVFPGETITLNQGLSVGSDVHLILGDGATLNANAGIIVNTGSKLTIYSQSANTGVLNATGKNSSAGIGGSSGQSAGTIEIYGGTITASGNDGGAGIGGGKGTTNHTTGKSGTITIGGQAKDVEATGSKGAAGIGGGIDGDGQAITITAGTVRATGATDGNAQAQGGAGIGGGARTGTGGSGSHGGTITISGSADVTAMGGNGAAGIGGGSSYDVAYFGKGGTITISGEANVKAAGGDFGAGIGSGCYGALSDITINGDGTVNATGGKYSAGIGQGQSSRNIAVSAGSIIIKKGDITAKGGYRGPGIGCGDGAHSLPYINIGGGAVNAIAGDGAAGIGWGAQTNDHPNDLIVISGGQVTASSINAYNGRIILSWTDQLKDFITCNGGYKADNNSNYYGIILEGEPFMVQGTGVRAKITGEVTTNFNNATIVPALTATLNDGMEGVSDQTDDLTRGWDYTVPECPFSAPNGKAFLGWQVGDDAANLLAPGYVIQNVSDNLNLTAVWGDTYTVTVDGAVKDYIKVSPTPNLSGATVTISVDQPEYLDLVAGSLQAKVEGDDTGLTLYGGGKTYAFIMPSENVTVSARFKLNTEKVPYVDAAGAAQIPVESYKMVRADDTQWEKTSAISGWYVVTQSTTLGDRVTVSGDVNLILCDGTTLTANKGIDVAGDNRLTIWAQSLGSAKGALVATGVDGYAGIGGGHNSNAYERGGTIVVNGGDISATGGKYAAGIGGSRNGAAGIEINGGKVTATGGMYAAAIGSGGVSSGRIAAEENDHISITGGHVEATGGLHAAAIGGGNYVDCGAITIEGGTVVSTAVSNNNDDPCYGAAIGGGKSGGCGNIAISGGSVEAVFSDFSYGAGIGSGCSGSCGDIEITGGVVAATTDNATNNPSRGACIGTGDSGSCTAINIKGGTIRVTANGNGACIGSGATAANDTPTACGVITISGGNVTTISKGNGAGIGSGLYSQCSSITISGGVVNATVEQGGHFGACIGHGQGGVNACQVNITGGMVTATHGSTGADESLKEHVAAIGGGWDSGIVTIAISGGTVIAYGNSDLDNSSPRIPQVTSIGRGRDAIHSSNDEVTLSYDDATRDTCVYAECFGQNVTLNKSFMNRDDSSQVYNEKTYSSASASEELRGKYLVASDSYGITVEEMQHGTVVPSVLKTVTVRPATEGNPEETDQVSCDVYRTQPGQTVTLNVAPDAGYKLAPGSLKVTYDGAGSPITPVQVQGDPTKYAFAMPVADATISATFFKHEFAYTAQGATITARCSAEPCDLPNRTATLTVKAPAGNLTYDGAEKPATISGDTDAMGTPNISYTKDGAAIAGAPKDAGTYIASITLGEGSGAATALVVYTIKPKSVSITGLTASDKTYDGTTTATAVADTAAVSGKVGKDDVTAAAGAASFDTAGVGTGKTVHFTGWSLSGEKAGNYVLSTQPASGTANITQRAITITAKNQSVEQGGSIAAATSQVSMSENGLVTGHTLGTITLTSSETDALTTSGTITPSEAIIMDASGNIVTSNYNVTYENGVLTVTKVKAKVTTAPEAKKPTYTGVEQALVTEGVADTGMEYALGNDATTAPEAFGSNTVPSKKDAGTYYVWYRAAADNDHEAGDPKCIAADINPAPLTITAKPKAITYGDKPVNDGVDYSGFVNGETASVLSGALGYDYGYEQFGDAGSYAITPKGLTAANYEISYVAGTLTVNPLVVDIAWSDAPLTFNGSAQVPTATVMGLLNGDKVAVALDGAQTNAGGPYFARATGLSGAKAGNYVLSDGAQKPAVFSIAKAAPRLSDVRVTRGYTVSSVSASVANVVPKNAGSVTYAKASDNPIDKVSQWAVSSNGTVTAMLANGAVGDTISLPVKVSSTNYEDTTINLVASLTELWEVVWLNGDGTALDRKLWAEGDAEPVTDKKPIKKATAQYSYTFAGWNEGAWNEAHNVKTYKATFNAATKKYTVKFVGADGKVLQSSSVAYGSTPKYAGKTPKKASTANYRFAFKGWTPAIAKVTKSATYKAAFSKIAKKAQTIKAKKSVTANAKADAKTKKLAKKKTVNLKKLAKASAKTKVAYKKANKVGGNKIVVNAKTGKVTLKKGLKAGTYMVKVKLTAPANGTYKAARAKTITLKVIVGV